MAVEALSTAGITFKYCAETTAGTKPTSGYTQIAGIKSIPDFNPEPNNLETTPLDETTWKTYIPGLKDVGGALAFTANLTSTFETAWSTLVSAEAALTGGKAMWFEVCVPSFKSFYFTGKPVTLGMSAIDVDSVLEVEAYITPTSIEGWDTSSS